MFKNKNQLPPFDECVQEVLRWEGGYVDDKNDPGGETNFGISKRSYPEENIRDMTRTRAIEIYEKDYWQACSCDKVPRGVDLLLFDAAVNQGEQAARRMIQAAANVPQDGAIGPITLQAVGTADQAELIRKFAAERGMRYAVTINHELYLRGWLRRLLDMTVIASGRVE